MNFLLDTDICSAYLKGDRRVHNRFLQYSGGSALSIVTAAELYSWAFRARTNRARLQDVDDLLKELPVLTVDLDVARRFGQVRAAQLDQGRPMPEPDLFIASTALVHDLTLVTHNVRDFAHLPGLRIVDWLAP